MEVYLIHDLLLFFQPQDMVGMVEMDVDLDLDSDLLHLDLGLLHLHLALDLDLWLGVLDWPTEPPKAKQSPNKDRTKTEQRPNKDLHHEKPFEP